MADAQSNPPAVSVLMPVRNCGSYIEEAVDCILRQTFADFEFLIVDDASTDDTWDRLKQFSDPRIRLSRNETNKGLAQNLNDLLETARGEFIARMDGDDTCDLERLELQVRFLEEHPEVGVVSSSFLWTDASGRDVQLFPQPSEDSEIKGRILVSCDGLVHAGALARRSLLVEAGGYRTAIGIAEDNDLWLRLGHQCQFHNLPRALYRWRQHPASSGSRQTEQNAALAMVRMYAIERRHCGEDSLARYSDEDLARVRQGRFVMPRVGDAAAQRRVLWELCDVLIAGARPAQSLRVAAATVRRWPLHWLGYAMVGRTMLNPRSYLRQFRIMRNYVGMLAYSLLGLNRDRRSG